MATILTSSQQTFVDITDQRKLSAYITSNLPKTQSEDPNVLPHTYAPSWASTNLVLTPVLFLDQTNVSPTASGVTISWKRKDGVASETALTSGETVKSGVLTVNQNKLASSSSGMITYICYISYYDSETKNTINITPDITYTLVKNAANAKLCTMSSDTYVFKYDTSQSLVGASQAALTAQVQGVTISKSAEIMKTSDQINSTVEMVKTKVDGSAVEELERRVTDVEQNASGMQITISSVRDAVDKQEQNLENYKLETSIYLRFTEKGLSIGKQNAGDESPYSIVIDNEKMSFQQNGMEVAYIQYNKMHINAIEAMDKLSVGAASDGGYFDFISTPQGMGIKWRNV